MCQSENIYSDKQKKHSGNIVICKAPSYCVNVFHVYRPTVFSGSRACSATLFAVSRWKRACSRTGNYGKECKAEGFLKILLGVFIVFVKTPLKIPNLCSSGICGRLIIRGEDYSLGNISLDKVSHRLHRFSQIFCCL